MIKVKENLSLIQIIILLITLFLFIFPGSSYGKEQYGPYLADDLGNISYRLENGDIAINTVAPDGCVYDNEGHRLNTLYYIWDKYKTEYENAAPDDILYFDSYMDLSTFIIYLQLERSDRQGQVITYGPQVSITKSALKKFENESSKEYKEIVESIGGSIPSELSVKQIINEVERKVKRKLTYDYDKKSVNYSMDHALASGTGVCYHLCKLMHDVLTYLGLEVEYEIGFTLSGESHVWLKILDDTTGAYIYNDPSLTRPAQIGNYTYYLCNYQMRSAY